MRDYSKSQALYERARKVTCGGSQTASKAPGRVGPIGGYPLYLSHGNGCRVMDVDGNWFIDWFGGNCAVTLGHGDVDVRVAVDQAADSGSLLPLPSPLEIETAERLCEVIPCAESIRFVKTGSEACAAAVRIARMATGRNHVIVGNSYHGWHDWYQVTKPHHPGIPDSLGSVVHAVEWGNLSAIEQQLGDVALVMIEPSLGDHPPEGYLQGVIDLAHQHGALVCFDEMITGCRWAVAGGQQYYGVTPDMATFGKSFGNGVPFAFVCGSREIMQHAWAISGTYGSDTIGLAACQAVLQAYRCEPVIDKLWRAGQQLQDGFNGLAKRLKAPVEMIGVPCRPRLRWECGDESAAVISLWQQELAERGVLVHPSAWNPSAAHHAEAVAQTLEACQRALVTVLAALSAGTVREQIRGELIQPAFVQRKIA